VQPRQHGGAVFDLALGEAQVKSARAAKGDVETGLIGEPPRELSPQIL